MSLEKDGLCLGTCNDDGESSEAGMLVEVTRAIRTKRWGVLLGWEPHPMNVQMKLGYLSRGDSAVEGVRASEC